MKFPTLVRLLALTILVCGHSAIAADGTKPWVESSVKEFVGATHYRFNLKADQDLLASIEKFAKENGITDGYLATAVGSLKRGAVRFPERSETAVFEGTQEVASLVGTINEKGAHLHISFADKDGAMHGGHVMPGCIVNGLEIVLVELREE